MDENYEKFISWISDKLGVQDEGSLKKKLEQLGEDGIKDAYNQFLDEEAQGQVEMQRAGGKLDYIKCLKQFASGGKVGCGCKGFKMTKKEDGGSINPEPGLKNAGPKFAKKAKLLKLQPKKVVMGQGMTAITGIVDKKQQGGTIVRGQNGTGYTQQDAANLKANGFNGTLKQWAAMNDQWNLADASTLVKPRMYGYGPMDRPGNVARQMNQAEWDYVRQNMGGDPRYATASTNGMLNDVYTNNNRASMMESGDTWRDVDYWVQKFRQAGQPAPLKTAPPIQTGLIASKQQGGKLTPQTKQQGQQGQQMMPSPEEVENQKIDMKATKQLIGKTGDAGQLTPIDQLKVMMKPKQIKAKPEKTIKLISKNGVLYGSEK